MSISLSSITKGIKLNKLILTIHGGEKVGKTTFACQSPNPIVIPAEKGSDHIDVARFPAPTCFDDLIQCINVLMTEDHDFETVILDSADAAESLAQKAVCEETHVNSLEEVGYGKAYKMADEKMFLLLSGLEALREIKGMHVFIVCHSKTSIIQDSRQGESYLKTEIDCRPSVAGKIKYMSDGIFFADIDAATHEAVKGAKKTVSSNGRRICCTELTKAYSAGNRFKGLPPIIDLNGADLWKWLQKNAITKPLTIKNETQEESTNV